MAHVNIYKDGRMEILPGPPPKDAKVVRKVEVSPADLERVMTAGRPKLTMKPKHGCCT